MLSIFKIFDYSLITKIILLYDDFQLFFKFVKNKKTPKKETFKIFVETYWRRKNEAVLRQIK